MDGFSYMTCTMFLFRLCTGPEEAARSTSRPNVVLIVADGVRQGDVSFMKQSVQEVKDMDAFQATPTLNELAEKGIVFESLYATGKGSFSSSSMFMAGGGSNEAPYDGLQDQVMVGGWGVLSEDRRPHT
jgi:hypothetical protein